MPALAVADALRAEGAEVAFVGGERAEKTLVPEAGYELHPLGALRGLDRRNPLRALGAALRTVGAVMRSLRLLRRERPTAVLGAGGYIAGPVGLAAVMRRVPLVLAEADSHLGLTNRVLAPFARRVCLAFPLEGREPPRYRVTGRPVPPPATDRAAARAHFHLGTEETCVVIFGGSLGARSINESAVDAFAGAEFRVLHVSGTRDYEQLRDRVMRPGYDLRPYLDLAEFSRALLAADLVVARSGGSVFEIAAHGRPALLVPYPHAAADHQTTNARWMAEHGAAVVVGDADLTGPRLAQEVARLLGDPARLAAMGRASAALALPHAALDVAGELLEAAREWTPEAAPHQPARR